MQACVPMAVRTGYGVRDAAGMLRACTVRAEVDPHAGPGADGGRPTGSSGPVLHEAKPMHPDLNLDEATLAQFCIANHICRLSLFGSRLHGTAGPDSDIDLLVEFAPDARPTLLDMARLEQELSVMLGGRRVDLRTAPELSRHFRDEGVRTAVAQYVMSPTDRWRVQHMIEAAEQARQFAAGRTRADLDADAMLCLALARLVEIIGEAAGRISAETRAELKDVP